MNYLIVSTYPETGTKNIGDKLIEQSTVAGIIAHDPDASFRYAWREADWDSVRLDVDWAHRIVFACFAIRRDVHKTYPYIQNIMNQSKPFICLSSGTSLDPLSAVPLSLQVTNDDRTLLREIARNAAEFSTRGYLTQQFCQEVGMKEAHFTGDVAFFGHQANKKNCDDVIKKIIISDPHYEKDYVSSFKKLISEIKTKFSEAQVTVAIHGSTSNRCIEICRQLNIPSVEIWKDTKTGLALYDDSDMHIGFRVHGHVSALSRGKISYLLEQDGRGCDYGLTLPYRISAPAYRAPSPSSLKRRIFNAALGMKAQDNPSVPPNCINQIMSLIERDCQNGFVECKQNLGEIEKFKTLINSCLQRFCEKNV